MSRACVVTSAACGRASARRNALSGLAILLGASSLLLLSGCGATNGGFNLADTSPQSEGVTLQGRVHGGQNPVVGASVNLFAAGTGGYAGAPTSLLTSPVTTDSNGNFSITGDWSCPAAPGDQVFLLVTGGNPGGGTNANLAMMSALGSCAGLSASSFIYVDEVTTVASAYSLAQFLTYASTIDTPPATAVAAGTTPNIGVPTSGASCTSGGHWMSTGAQTCNYVGLKNAMATVPNLAYVVTTGITANSGQVPANSKAPSYTAAGITTGNDSYVPSARINTLADILAACVNSTGGTAGDGSNCGNLFHTTTPTSTGVAPTDTLQAILNLAQDPYFSTTNLTGPSATFFALSTSTPPFATPAPLSAAPNDWTLALGFTSGGYLTAATGSFGETLSEGLSIDQQGNIWSSDTADQVSTAPGGTGGIVGMNNQGVPLSPNTTSTTWGAFQTNANYPFDDPAIAPNGNIYFGNFGDGSFAAIGPSGSSVLAPVVPPFTQDIDTSYVAGIALDTSNNIWLLGSPSSGGAAVGEFNSTGTELTPYYTENTTTGVGYSGISLDTTGHVWFSTVSSDYEVSASTGSLVTIYGSSFNEGELSVSSTGDVFGCKSQDVYEDVPGGSPDSLLYNGTGGCYASSGYGPNAIDGLGNLWMPILGTAEASGTGHLDEVATTGTNAGKTISPATYGFQGDEAPGGSPANGETENLISKGISGTNQITGTAVDGSGNIWVLNGQADVNLANHEIVEFVGLGAPTVTPTALALKYNTFSQLP
jgi:hypothetical protein